MSAVDAPVRPPAAGGAPPSTRELAAGRSARVLVLAWTLAGVAALTVWLLLFGLAFSALYESHAQHDLYGRFRHELAAGTAPVGGVIAEGAPVAVLNAPRAGLHGVVVVQGTTSRSLQRGPGHLPGTPLPGQAGASVLMGRATSYGAPFARITALRPGDRITVTTGQGTFSYEVEDVRRPGDPFPAQLLPGGGQLTLATAESTGWRSGWAPSRVVYVDAKLRGTGAASPGVGPDSDADRALAGDTRGLYPLILWLQLLVVAVVGGVWADARWGRWQSWLVATPVALAGLWGASTAFWLLLPNLL